MAKTAKDIKILIMSGGKGSRMWPISNMAHPKQFESILGKKSMFRETVERVLDGFDPKDIYIATSEKFKQQIIEQASEVSPNNFIFEPAMRDNLGALGLATAIINHRHPDSVMIILWGADHVVKKPDIFLKVLKNAADIASKGGSIVHVDTLPNYPSIHNGWIEIGDQVDKIDGFPVYEFIRQVEKPDLQRAKEFYTSDKYLIHTGYMATKPSLFLNYYEKYAPETYAIIKKIEQTIDTPDFQQTLEQEYPKFEKLSVDYGLFEKLPPKTQLELPADFGWIDVGTWELLYHGLDKDENGNVVIGDVEIIDTKNSLLIGKSKGQMGVVGLDGMIAVETDEGMLVCPLEKAAKVRDLYKILYEQA